MLTNGISANQNVGFKTRVRLSSPEFTQYHKSSVYRSDTMGVRGGARGGRSTKRDTTHAFEEIDDSFHLMGNT